MEQGKIMEAEVPTVRVGATPTGLTAPPPPQPPQGFLQAGALPAAQPTASKLDNRKYFVAGSDHILNRYLARSG